MKKLLLMAAVVGALAVSGCSAQTPAPDAGEAVTETPEAAVAEEFEVEAVQEIVLPDGFPQVVEISTLPTHMQDAFAKAGTGQAVAVAEGVWAELPPGATAEDAVAAQVFSGFCASKEAFEREYLNGESTAGTCW